MIGAERRSGFPKKFLEGILPWPELDMGEGGGMITLDQKMKTLLRTCRTQSTERAASAAQLANNLLDQTLNTGEGEILLAISEDEGPFDPEKRARIIRSRCYQNSEYRVTEPLFMVLNDGSVFVSGLGDKWERYPAECIGGFSYNPSEREKEEQKKRSLAIKLEIRASNGNCLTYLQSLLALHLTQRYGADGWGMMFGFIPVPSPITLNLDWQKKGRRTPKE